MTTIKTATLASAAALFALTSVVATPTFAGDKKAAESVHCYGVNSCKGTSDCKTAKNDCKGQNSCKGQGFKELSKKACATAGGSETAPQ